MVQALVIDPSVLIQGFIQETYTAHVLSLLGSLSQDEPLELHIPEFCMLECANILWKQVRFHNVPLATSKQTLALLIETPTTIHNAKQLLPRALEIGVTHHLAVYDSMYIALAETLNLPLLTIDVRQRTAAQALGISIKAITDFPPIPPDADQP